MTDTKLFPPIESEGTRRFYCTEGAEESIQKVLSATRVMIEKEGFIDIDILVEDAKFKDDGTVYLNVNLELNFDDPVAKISGVKMDVIWGEFWGEGDRDEYKERVKPKVVLIAECCLKELANHFCFSVQRPTLNLEYSTLWK